MNAPSAHDLLPDELAALMHFYAESGVAWLSEDKPVDRFADLAAHAAERSTRVPSGTSGPASNVSETRPPKAVPAVKVSPSVAVPDAEAVEAAQNLAASAETPEALIAAVEGFSACNLKFSARHTVFAAGRLDARIAVIGGMPAAEDDREGRPFAGAAGQILTRMLSGSGVDESALLIVNIIPWRTPGDRAPTLREVEICRPFSQRLMELVHPEAVLVLGNLPVRILSDQPRAGIHATRGKWFGLAAGASEIRAFATFHPQELLATPACKKLAWQDMLRFNADLNG